MWWDKPESSRKFAQQIYHQTRSEFQQRIDELRITMTPTAGKKRVLLHFPHSDHGMHSLKREIGDQQFAEVLKFINKERKAAQFDTDHISMKQVEQKILECEYCKINSNEKGGLSTFGIYYAPPGCGKTTSQVIAVVLAVLPFLSAEPNDKPIVNQGVAFLQERPLLFSGDTWTVVVDLHLSTYRLALKAFIDNVHSVKTIGSLRFETIIDDQTSGLADQTQEIVSVECDMLSHRAGSVLDQLDQISYTLAPGHARGRRSLVDIVGTGLHFLFGVGDTAVFNEINSKIQNLNNTNQAVLHLLHSQLSYINDSVHTGHKNEKAIAALATAVTLLTNNIFTLEQHLQQGRHNTTQFMLDSLRLSTMFRGFLNQIVSIQQTVNMLEAALTVTADGRLSAFFVAPVKMLELLSTIQNNLPSGSSLLTNVELSDVYQYYNGLSDVYAAVVGDKIRLYITVPIKSNNKYFTMYSIKPLSTKIANQSIALRYKLAYDYLAVTPDHQNYIELSHLDLDQCKKVIGTIICPPLKNLNKANSISCIFALFLGLNEQVRKLCPVDVILEFIPQFYMPSIGDNWVYNVEKDVMNIICPGQINGPNHNHATHELQGAGVINIPSRCRGVSAKWSLESHSSTTLTTIKTPNIVLPDLADMIALFNSSTKTKQAKPILGNHDEIRELLSQIDLSPNPPKSLPITEWQRQIEEMQRPTWQDYAQATWFHASCGALSLIIILALIIWKRRAIYARCCARATPRRSDSTPMVRFAQLPSAPPSSPLQTMQKMIHAQGHQEQQDKTPPPRVVYVTSQGTHRDHPPVW
jgi:Baculovirus F protein